MPTLIDTVSRKPAEGAPSSGPQSAAGRVREKAKGTGGLYQPRVPIYPKLVHGHWRRI